MSAGTVSAGTVPVGTGRLIEENLVGHCIQGRKPQCLHFTAISLFGWRKLGKPVKLDSFSPLCIIQGLFVEPHEAILA